MSPLTLKAKAAIAVGVLAVSCGISSGIAWNYQGSRWQADVATLKADHVSALKAQSDKALEDYNRMGKQKDDALKEQAAQLVVATRNASAAAASANGLRKQLDKVPSLVAAATQSALAEYATTTSGLLGSCTEEYQRMAEIAQRHATDLRAVLNSWPRGEP